MALATADDVEARLLRPLSSPEFQYVNSLLNEAEGQILNRVPNLQNLLVSQPRPGFEAAVRSAEAWAVARFFRNPDGRSQESISGEYSYSRDAATASGALYISDQDWAAILGTSATAAGSFRSRRVTAYGDA